MSQVAGWLFIGAYYAWLFAGAYHAWLAGRSHEESHPLGQEPGWSSAGGKVAWGRMGKVTEWERRPHARASLLGAREGKLVGRGDVGMHGGSRGRVGRGRPNLVRARGGPATGDRRECLLHGEE